MPKKTQSATRKQSQKPTMDFPQAIAAVTNKDAKITKLEWDNADYGMLRNGLLMLRIDEEWFQWILNDGDLMGTDWVIAK